MEKKNKKMSRTKILFIISMVLLVGWFGFSMIPSVSVILGGGCGFFFFIMVFATIISFVNGSKKGKVEIVYIQKSENNEIKELNTKVCRYCGSENKPEEVKCYNCGANLKNREYLHL